VLDEPAVEEREEELRQQAKAKGDSFSGGEGLWPSLPTPRPKRASSGDKLIPGWQPEISGGASRHSSASSRSWKNTKKHGSFFGAASVEWYFRPGPTGYVSALVFHAPDLVSILIPDQIELTELKTTIVFHPPDTTTLGEGWFACDPFSALKPSLTCRTSLTQR